jgi:hypothetical protein
MGPPRCGSRVKETNGIGAQYEEPAALCAMGRGTQICGPLSGRCAASAPQSGMHAVTVISTRSSGEFSAATVTVVLAGLPVGKYFPYSSL